MVFGALPLMYLCCMNSAHKVDVVISFEKKVENVASIVVMTFFGIENVKNRPNSSSNDPNFFCVETLKSSLAKVLVTFYPFAGRLCVDDKTGRLEIDCNGEGVVFVKAVTDSTIDEFGDFTPSMKTRKLLVPTVDTTISSCPLLLLQIYIV
ncbi:Anthranilate n-benzoyltransferase protein [Thalictrum thalictroides]|uniref:Anthranilate n-benzoyltransferase protein n=1 Tax=Thalictrum thalictroides TaxID=46969 RepID=A0A7J6XE30_THATH|nr:Anthranilate n-benzoyltransferase protein [Thalictrum thalictroides]